jgi:hypothetical protein
MCRYFYCILTYIPLRICPKWYSRIMLALFSVFLRSLNTDFHSNLHSQCISVPFHSLVVLMLAIPCNFLTQLFNRKSYKSRGNIRNSVPMFVNVRVLMQWGWYKLNMHLRQREAECRHKRIFWIASIWVVYEDFFA